jgi:uncharacterized protein (DUF4415 family)
METTFSKKLNRVLILPSDDEDAQIQAGIAQDPDNPEWTAAEMKALRPVGRPLGSGTKTLVHIRLDTDMLQQYKATGAGWQTRMNQILRSGAKKLQTA